MIEKIIYILIIYFGVSYGLYLCSCNQEKIKIIMETPLLGTREPDELGRWFTKVPVLKSGLWCLECTPDDSSMVKILEQSQKSPYNDFIIDMIQGINYTDFKRGNCKQSKER